MPIKLAAPKMFEEQGSASRSLNTSLNFTAVGSKLKVNWGEEQPFAWFCRLL